LARTGTSSLLRVNMDATLTVTTITGGSLPFTTHLLSARGQRLALASTTGNTAYLALNAVGTAISASSDQTLKVYPDQINRLKRDATLTKLLAFGKDGLAYQFDPTSSNTFARMNNSVNEAIYDAYVNNTLVYLVGENGLAKQGTHSGYASLTMTDMTTASGQTIAGALANRDLYSIVLTQNKRLFAVGAGGALVYSPLAYGTGSVSPSVIAQGSVDFYGAAVKVSSENVLICGGGGRIQEQFGATALINQHVFIPGIADIHFKDASSATLIAKNFVVRSTTNAGGSWNLVKPAGTTIPAATYGKVWTLAGGKSLLFGSGNTLLYNANTDLTVTAFAATDVKALAAGTNDQNLFFVDGNLVRKVNLTSLIPTTVHTLSGSNPVNALQVFANGDHILVGDGGLYKHYTASGTLLSYSTGLPSTDFKALAFLDNLNGIIVGNGGVYYKSTNATISTSGYMESATWEVRNLASGDPMGVSGANIYALAVTSPTGVLIGGENPVSGSATTPYVRCIYDAGGRYSNRFWYDRLGRLVVSRNSRQEQEGKYSYLLYDALGRVYEAGEKTENPDTELQFAGIFGTTVSGYFNPATIDDVRLGIWITAGGERKEVTRSYYDNVAISGITGLSADLLTQRLRIVHTTYEETYDGNDQTYDHATHYSYDIHGNVKTLIQDNRKMATDFASLAAERFKRLDYSYDLLSGNVHRMSVQAGAADQWHHAYTYDADNRLRRVYTNTHEPLTPIGRLTQNKENELLANADWQRDAQYYFYDHGPLARVEIGQNNLQGSDYIYNLQGWIKSVNGSDLKENFPDPGKDSDPTGINALFAKDVYHFGLHYYEGDYMAISGAVPLAPVNTGSVAAGYSSDLYNGNIRYMETRILNPQTREAMPMLNAYRYDQLNRLAESRSFETGYSDTEWKPDSYRDEYFNAFAYDAMGNILTQQRHKRDGTQIEDLTYRYQRDDNDRLVRNCLYHVNDNIGAGVDSTDIDDMGLFDAALATINGSNNYVYDKEGRLVKDRQEEIDSIIWTVTGKVKEIIRTAGSEKKNVSFDYNSLGQRIAKHVYNNEDWMLEKSTYYILDPQGNQLSMYEHTVTKRESNFYLAERNIYGSSRLGATGDTVNMADPHPLPSYGWAGNRSYELSNHLGNVLTVISDIVYPFSTDETSIASYVVGLNQVSDYSPFGVQLDGRTISWGIKGNEYRYSFQGQEHDDEIKGEGNSLNYEYRMHDPRLGRFFAIDPLNIQYPNLTPYQFSSNSPIYMIELEGLEGTLYTYKIWYTNDGKTRNSVLISVKEVEGLKQDVIKLVIQPHGEPNGKTHHLEYYLRNEDGTKGYASPHYNVDNKPTVSELNKVFKGIKPNPAPPLSTTASFVHGSNYYESDPTHYEWLEGHGPFEKVEVKLNGPSITIGAIKYDYGLTLKENGDGSGSLWSFNRTSLTTNVSNGVDIGAPSLMFDFYFNVGSKDKPNVALKTDGKYGFFKTVVSTNSNGENKLSLGITAPSKPSVKVSIETELKKTEKKLF
ncbi:RHS repeat-associated core domain-containing protein, partial [Fluviicola sp.]|uniref:RHS repeat domain-containing protein n=1 Tax=Fluviicola sp. TaxID=1917219 RepID=UPI0031E142F1